MEFIVLNPNFSTTRMVMKSAPELSAEKRGGLRTRGYYKQSYPEIKSDVAGKRSKFYPLVTIITVVYNNDRTFAAAINSVLNQSYDNIEYIIVDGGSTDGTLDLIRQHEEQIDYWISEPDNGLYDAMNKGIALATGEIIGILNSDDLYYPDTVAQVVEQYRRTHSPCVIYGNMDKFTDTEDAILSAKGDLSDRAFATGNIIINHPTCFVSRSLYQDFGGFKPEYEVGADRELMMRFNRQGVKFISLERAIARFRLGGTTSNRSLSNIFNQDLIQEYRILSAHNTDNIIVAKVLSKKIIQSLRQWLAYRVLGEKLADKIIMLYISYKFSKPSKSYNGKDRVNSEHKI